MEPLSVADLTLMGASFGLIGVLFTWLSLWGLRLERLYGPSNQLLSNRRGLIIGVSALLVSAGCFYWSSLG